VIPGERPPRLDPSEYGQTASTEHVISFHPFLKSASSTHLRDALTLEIDQSRRPRACRQDDQVGRPLGAIDRPHSNACLSICRQHQRLKGAGRAPRALNSQSPQLRPHCRQCVSRGYPSGVFDPKPAPALKVSVRAQQYTEMETHHSPRYPLLSDKGPCVECPARGRATRPHVVARVRKRARTVVPIAFLESYCLTQGPAWSYQPLYTPQRSLHAPGQRRGGMA
jgi:hypothetical protein